MRALWPFPSCPAGWKLSRAAAEGPDWKLARHLAGCERCTADFESLRALARTAATLRAGSQLSPEARETIAARLMLDAPAPGRGRPRPATQIPHATRVSLGGRVPALAAATLVAAAAMAYLWRPRAARVEAPRPRSPVPASAAAPSAATIRAPADRPPPSVLAAGPEPPVRARSRERERPRRAVTGSRPAPPAAETTQMEEAAPAPSFHRAWSLLRSGDSARAADAFAELEDASRGTTLEADALYWRAVALSRAGERQAARALLDVFLARFPGSSRAGDAALALGHLLVDLGEPAPARRAFERAAHDPSERVRASATAGLAGLPR